MGISIFKWNGVNGEKPFWVGLFDQLFQPARNQVEMVEKAFV